MLVINTVLSVMAYDYPSEKLSVYLSDDGGSELTFYALLEAACFAKHWIPYCKKFNAEPRSPAVYFSLAPDPSEFYYSNEYSTVKKLYEEMEKRIEDAIKCGSVSTELAKQHKGFSEWNAECTPGNHQPIVEVEFPGFEQAMLIGTGCFHRRESLCGKTYSKSGKVYRNNKNESMSEENTSILEERAKSVASCTCEKNTGWGTDMGMLYGCPVEDVITGLLILCKGWRSIYYNPPKESFLGMAPLTLGQFLVQHKRWSEGMFQIFLSKYCPFIYGHGKITLRLQMAYTLYLVWSPMSLPMLYYAILPSLCLLKGIPLFPKVSSSWFLPFAYVIVATQAYSLGECIWCGETITSWWNMHKMRMMRRTSSYFFSFIDTIFLRLGVGSSGFAVTAKVAEDDALARYEKGIMEFGPHSPMFVVLALLAMLNLICFVGGVIRVVMEGKGGRGLCEEMALQFVLCGVLVMGSMPIYQALFFRKDKGCLPASVAFQSVLLAGLACLVPLDSS